MTAGLRRNPGPVIGTLVAVTAAATLTVAAASVAGAHILNPPGRLASASVVVAGSTELDVTIGSGQNAQAEGMPLPVYRGVDASLAQTLARVPGAASAVGESGFPGGVVQPGEVDLIAVTARPGVAPGLLASRIAAALHGGKGYTIATGAARGDLANLSIPVEQANGHALATAVLPPVMLIAMFVLAGTAALSVSVRWRRFALIRAVGATRGQVRRAVLGELALLGQIAVSTLEAGNGAMGVRVGSRVTAYLPDGTPYRATVSALYSRSLAVGDVLIPGSVAAGHTGTAPGFTEILVSGGSASGLAAIAAANPGTRVDSPRVYNEQSDEATAQNGFANNLLLGVIALLAAVAVVNTLVMATLSRRRLVALLGRVGATRGQLAAMFGWQALFVAVTGIVAGVAAGLVTLLTVTRVVTGSWAPDIATGDALALIAVVAALTAGATLIPFRAMARTQPTLAAG
jgi:hypothetical protein